MNVLTAHERIFLTARIFSDIRPVFGDSIESASAAVVVHNLKITVRRNEKEEDIFIALDNNDLRELKEVVDRAEKKTKALASILEKSHVKFLDVREH
jgi:hypothetical protein